jgi:EAL domain-containing protein (putative c-di-GMP-specific phosphodiesterase class I)
VVAEGTETETHIACLKAVGCQFAQGYHFSRPVDADTAHDLLELPARRFSARALPRAANA